MIFEGKCLVIPLIDCFYRPIFRHALTQISQDQISYGLVHIFFYCYACSNSMLNLCIKSADPTSQVAVVGFCRQSGECFFQCWLSIPVFCVSVLLNVLSWCFEGLLVGRISFSSNIWLEQVRYYTSYALEGCGVSNSCIYTIRGNGYIYSVLQQVRPMFTNG